ncbi:unnamed protein product [Ectocarpus sp. 8 AP-2014]
MESTFCLFVFLLLSWVLAFTGTGGGEPRIGFFLRRHELPSPLPPSKPTCFLLSICQQDVTFCVACIPRALSLSFGVLTRACRFFVGHTYSSSWQHAKIVAWLSQSSLVGLGVCKSQERELVRC